MKIEKGKTVSLTYELFLDGFDGELVESVKTDNPLVFEFGNGDMLESFEEQLVNKVAGDEFKFSLDSAQAYGEEDEEAFAEFPKDLFLQGENTELPKEGDYVPMQDNEGNKFDGIVHEVKDEAIVIDFNHPLAGENLFFTGKIIDVK
jgi:FKBP-type peptidyl-prolyl cis-trans isomerase SlyD